MFARLAGVDDYDLENTRRSLVMAGPDANLSWTAGQALELVDELIAARARLAEFERGPST